MAKLVNLRIREHCPTCGTLEQISEGRYSCRCPCHDWTGRLCPNCKGIRTLIEHSFVGGKLIVHKAVCSHCGDRYNSSDSYFRS